MRRALILLGLCAALAAPASAAATVFPAGHLVPIRLHGPRVRTGTIRLQSADPRVRVIASLPLPPLARRYGRGLAAYGARRKLAVHSTSSQAYLAEIARAQARAVTELRAAIPQARVQERFRVVLDAITISVPNSKLPKLLRLGQFKHVYPVFHYTLADDTSPGVIGAPQLEQAQGADGHGMKIGVVDDGIDQTNPFFNPAGYAYPAGFPKGNTKYTTPKVIVARAFPGPGSGTAGSLPLDPTESFHGTHVAGIAAGDAGTTAPASAAHPKVTGLSGVAPKAYLGNYRVFTIPTPFGDEADSPEIIAAFEAAVSDGMDVINFSGGGPQTDPANDAMIPVVQAVARAGVVLVIAAGNDRDQYGNGSVGSPGSAPDAITVAATSNTHVFAPGLNVTTAGAPADLSGIPFQSDFGNAAASVWASGKTLVDVGAITGTDGHPVERHLCGPAGDLASPDGTLPAGSLTGKIALVSRGLCPFVTKAAAAAAAGAAGLVLVDNRGGEADQIPLPLGIPAGMISDLDGANLRAFMDAHGGSVEFTVGASVQELETGRSGVITSFSSSGPTAFGHDLKPDISAPGGQIISSTLPNTDSSRFAVFDGTSMATPHVAGSAALLLELHPGWTPEEVKSALMSTASPAWANTARTVEAPAIEEGGGLVWLPRAADPLLFTAPASLSFEDVNVLHGAASKGLVLQVSDAGGGSGLWSVTVDPQAATTGASLDVPGTVSIAPNGEVDVPVVARAYANAVQGENYGFLVLTRGSDTRRIPYLFYVDRPALASLPVHPLTKLALGDTSKGKSHVATYRYPTSPFGNAPDTQPMDETGSEHVYSLLLKQPVANAGVSVLLQSGIVDPWLLGADDESSVQGYDGTPVDVNGLTYDSGYDISSAAVSFPSVQRYYVAVDSGVDPYSGASVGGAYLLNSWVNDVTPPTLRLLTSRVSTGRPTIAVRTRDSQSGVDPYSLVIGYDGVLVGAADYDPISGIAVFPLPAAAPKLRSGRLRMLFLSSDYEEAKNIDTTGTNILPNTRTAAHKLDVVHGPTANWLLPTGGTCIRQKASLLVSADAPGGVKSVHFILDGRRLANGRHGAFDLWSGKLGRVTKGKHTLEAAVATKGGHTATSRIPVHYCR
ncbi:MAG TPA: S8 family serine peptidase [Gaiellaceae bacterium]|nr:S8 family serine peptidase [Gaiellaceae bacterium]